MGWGKNILFWENILYTLQLKNKPKLKEYETNAVQQNYLMLKMRYTANPDSNRQNNK